jgi:hypothetical protein
LTISGLRLCFPLHRNLALQRASLNVKLKPVGHIKYILLYLKYILRGDPILVFELRWVFVRHDLFRSVESLPCAKDLTPVEPFFDAESRDAMDVELASVEERAMALATEFLTYRYRHDISRQYAVHGFSRRMYMMMRCVFQVFELLPTRLVEIPDDESVDAATINIQSFVFNMYGAIDNLAWIWVSEKGVLDAKGRPLSPGRIGLGPHNIDVRASLPGLKKRQLDRFDAWFKHLHYFRNALAQRIPLYIPPYIISPRNSDLYAELDRKQWQADSAESFEAIKAEMERLVCFHPIMTHSLYVDRPPVIFHPQLLGDFRTVEKIGRIVLGAMREIT